MLEKRVFIQGMNGDLEDRLIEPGEYRYALNIRAGVSDNNSQGVVENVKGNTEITFNLPAGDNTCIGSFEDLRFRVVYYFIHNSLRDSVILEYNYETGVIRQIIKSKALNFSLDHYITGVNLIEGELLYWTDDYNEPRAFNVNRDYSDVLINTGVEQIISAIKYAPQTVIGAEYDTGTRRINNVFGKQFQFRYSYVYLDNEQSAWSPISKTPINQTEEQVQAGNNIATDQNNMIKLSIPAGNNFIKEIRLAVREGNLGKFSQFRALDATEAAINSQGTITYDFYNDDVRIAIDENDSNKLYDAVPKLAKAQEVIDGNRLTYGNITEGFDLIETEMSAEVDYLGVKNDITFPVPAIPKAIVYAEEGVTAGDVGEFISDAGRTLALGGLSPFPIVRFALDINDNFPSSSITSISNRAMEYIYFGGQLGPTFVNGELSEPKEGDVVSVTIGIVKLDGSETLTKTYSVTVGPNEPRQGVIDRLLLDINNDSFWDIQTQDGSRNFRVITAEPVPDGTNTRILIVTNIDPSNLPFPVPPGDLANLGYQWQMDLSKCEGNHLRDVDSTVSLIFKHGATHPLGVVYADKAGRLSTIMGVENVDVLPYSDVPSGQEGTNAIDLTINHLPPSWAETMHVVYAKNTTIDNFIHCAVNAVRFEGDRMFLDISPTVQLYPENSSGAIITYGFTKGDRLRFIRYRDESWVKEYVDVEVLELTDDNEVAISDLPDGFAPSFAGMMVEIYTPRNVAEEDQFLYYEIGESYPIINGFHTANSQDQTSTQPAVVRLENQGDTYFRRRNLDLGSGFTRDNYDTLVEDPNFSDFRDSRNYHIGRPNVFTKDAQEIRRPTTIYYSNPFIPDTNVNGLSSFYLESFEEYDKNYGSIQKLYSEDKKLLCFQELKVGQILVNELIYRDLSGGFNVGASQTILSTMVYYNGEYGISTHPESFAVYGNRKYFVDVNRGAVLRLSTDGITPISENRMRTYFNNKFKGELLFGWNPIIGVYDKRFDEYVLAIRSGELLGVPQSETIAFSEPLKKWTTFYSFIPDYMSGANVDIVSWKEGRLYIHNFSGVDRNNFYGEQFNSKIEVIANENPSNIKFYKTIQEESTTPWYMSEGSNQYGQSTNLIVEDFDTIEGHHYAGFWKDVNTPNIANPLIEGDTMRSYTMSLLLENDSTDEEKLFSVGVKYEASELSNR